MQRSRVPPQLVRLILLTVLIVASYVGARAYLTPKTFGQYGHYRGAALDEAAGHRLLFGGTKSCAECHDETFAKTAKAKHRAVGCESCHGPSRKHARDPDVTTTKVTDEYCVRCHIADAARPAKLQQVKLTEHYPGDSCIECHVAHQPNKSK